MMNWQPGDKALCTDTERRPASVEVGALKKLSVGATYTVERVRSDGDGGLWLVEVTTTHAFYADRFVKEAE